jgi:alkylresorcinol/alkylpyrone synthase
MDRITARRPADGKDGVRLLSLATAVPPHVLMQADVVEAARGLFAGRFAEFDRLAGVFLSAGVTKRHAARPIDWYAQPRGWPERTAAYLEVAGALFAEAAGKALSAAGLRADQIDTVVTASSTGIATPSIEARELTRLGMRSDVQRVPVFGLGCAAGVSGLAIAARMAEARPGARVLFVAVELCTLAFRLDELTKANIVATALFGDGAAACVLSTQGDGHAAVEGGGDHTWPDTLDIMGWNVDPTGFGVIFARAIPGFATAEMGGAVSGILERLGLCASDVDRFVCHAGGAKVISALETALALPPETLDHERAVLAEYGNMSAPTVLFVLDRVLATAMPGRAVLIAMGPGFTASCVSLVRAA